jgi:hypothetical protein
MEKLEKYAQLIDTLKLDIKAEVVAANLYEDGVQPTEALFIPQSSFKRSFSKDLLGAEIISLSEYFQILGLLVSRDSLYDALPEGMFHHESTTPKRSGKDLAGESRRLKEEETAARRFFHPFDNEFLYQRTQLELQERKILSKIVENLFDDFFIDFWKIDRNLPTELITQLIILLPFAHRIAGNYELINLCLEAILKQEVSYRLFYESKVMAEVEDESEREKGLLGNCNLGNDMITVNRNSEMLRRIEFTIGPVESSEVDIYLQDGKVTKFMDCFFDYFIPFEIEPSFKVEVEEGSEFVIGVEGVPAVMGYSTVI